MTTPASPAVPRPAATVILARNISDGIEVFMMERTTAVEFAKGMHVFPGGALDRTDHHPEIAALCVGLDDQLASQTLGIDQGGLAYWIAAIRECFEESGLLLGYREDDHLLRLGTDEAARLAALRIEMAENKLSFLDILQREAVKAATDRIAYFSHWVTQAGRPRRYDTRFFVAQAPEGQTALQDNHETVGQLWVQPGQALEMNRAGALNMMFPTIKTLESLAPFKHVEELLEYARKPRPKQVMAPVTGLSRSGEPHILIPGDYAYAEIKKLDFDNRGVCCSYIQPGQAVTIGQDVLRVTAANPGMMTGPGTNSYLIGNAVSGVAVIDPGPLLDEHIDALLAAAPGPIRWILCTHTHLDHSPAAAALKQRTGATVIGMPPPLQPNQDQTFKPDHIVSHQEKLDIAGTVIRVIHTPGHASNQVCYLLESQNLLFTGDHIMQGSTVVIGPPDGNMAEYLASLRLLLNEKIEHFAPGHGFLMDKPAENVERILIHRQDRENKVIAALRKVEHPTTLENLVKIAYDDAHERLHTVAQKSLLAHLQKLRDEQRAVVTDGLWSLPQPARAT
ncbi:MBL fold metallo-hydrolase [Zwartia sp.]|uniref:MBL fold metallo-hydrolase n=1 Tax=Zwartia sp. TaxID=2978004 RepID=UPI0027176FE6|nr:MBL fold metallo-hydrolase [Zwartia sp.]MDO9026103.1 MBL fold metallo-hydrolase [Zwartia sp.]